MTTPPTDADPSAAAAHTPPRSGLTYRESGVDIEAAGALVGRIAALTRLTARPGAAVDLGGFGAVFDPRAAGYADPLLVASTDGVGTKLKVAQALGRHETIGIDLVAMVANDLVVQGAEPLAFLDYIATGTLAPDVLARVVEGISAGCQTAGCALIGGETAEMPGMYDPGVYDLAGFAVGAVERGALLPRTDVAAGDTVLGLAASGLHSNGFSLVRRLLARDGIDLAGPAPFDASRTLGDVLLTPTRIYVKPCLAAARTGRVKAMAHITGGGLIDNIPRVLPAGLGVRLDGTAWRLPPEMRWLAEAGPVALTELAHTFNCGIGMVLVVAPDHAAAVTESLAGAGEPATRIGQVVAVAEGAPLVAIDAMASWAV